MKQFSALVLLASLLISGCATHYTERPTPNTVELHLFNPSAKEVFFYSSTNDFTPQAMQRNTWRYWTVTVEIDQQFKYFYIVDGKVVIPECDLREQDDFGRYNCIYSPTL